ncbi:hypothetical protein [Sphaerotilus mobilis]|uniref:Uncharacterized protein n=1 Tax=Sphaerotilus mobilis TaxID=47994 RepID=A0A4Q7LS74_9BURK|nr:hypothetical protein [Sphaerotilus mobilis]RZS57107.1 hypothetical protein EV685_1671 [Sphaerotilus mobilis]
MPKPSLPNSRRASRTLSATVLALACCAAVAAGTAKDVVVDRVLQPALAPAGVVAAAEDAMVVSVLLESPDGTLSPRGTDKLFQTGDRFRVKLVASRDAKVSLYNTNPRGETGSKPLWEGVVKVGQDTISPRLALTGSSGVDQLHVLMEPQTSGGVFAWLGNWLDNFKDGRPGSANKDIQLDVQNTETASYLVNHGGRGLVATIRIVHTAR